MFTGAMTAMVTPFRGGELDETRLRQQIEFQISGGIDVLVPVGSTGESPTLSWTEHKRVIELTVETARGRVPVVAGVGANSTSEAIELHAFARRVGAAGGLSVVPYYNKPTQEGMYRHFMTLADKVDLPIVLYNIPGRTGVTMLPETVARLRKNPHIVAIKESTGSLDIATEIASLCDITIISGDDSLTLPLISVGAKGVISVLSNLMPREVKALVGHAMAGEFTRAKEVHLRLFPLTKSLFLDGNPAGIKAAMRIAGTDTGELRLPLVEATDGTRKRLAALMSELAVGK